MTSDTPGAVSRPDPVCDRCGAPEWHHTSVEKFCPFISTFRAATMPEARHLGSDAHPDRAQRLADDRLPARDGSIPSSGTRAVSPREQRVAEITSQTFHVEGCLLVNCLAADDFPYCDCNASEQVSWLLAELASSQRALAGLTALIQECATSPNRLISTGARLVLQRSAPGRGTTPCDHRWKWNAPTEMYYCTRCPEACEEPSPRIVRSSPLGERADGSETNG